MLEDREQTSVTTYEFYFTRNLFPLISRTPHNHQVNLNSHFIEQNRVYTIPKSAGDKTNNL